MMDGGGGGGGGGCDTSCRRLPSEPAAVASAQPSPPWSVLRVLVYLFPLGCVFPSMSFDCWSASPAGRLARACVTKTSTKKRYRGSPKQVATRDSSGGWGLCHLLSGGDSCTILGGTAMPTLTTTSSPSRTAHHIMQGGVQYRGSKRAAVQLADPSPAAATSAPAGKQHQGKQRCRPPMHPPTHPPTHLTSCCV